MNTIITITGPTCSGKTYLEDLIIDAGIATRVVASTSRPIRSNETEGNPYFFRDKDDPFWQSDLIEFSQYNNHYYGLSKDYVDQLFEIGKPICIIAAPDGLIQLADACRRYGWCHFSIYKSSKQKVILERLMTRFSNDISKDDNYDCISTYVSRLESYLKYENSWEFFFNYGLRIDDAISLGIFVDYIKAEVNR